MGAVEPLLYNKHSLLSEPCLYMCAYTPFGTPNFHLAFCQVNFCCSMNFRISEFSELLDFEYKQKSIVKLYLLF